MSVLQKRAWSELVIMLVVIVVATGSLALMVRNDTKGVAYVLVSVVGAAVLGLVAYLQVVRTEAGLDEREKHILGRACMLAAASFVMAVGAVAFVAFFIVGGAGRVPVYLLPATFFGALFVAQFVQSAAILVQFTREQADG
jgi:hypothetical protein